MERPGKERILGWKEEEVAERKEEQGFRVLRHVSDVERWNMF